MQLWKALKAVDRREGLVFFLILIVASFLRFYKMPELMPFSGDQGRDLLSAANMVETGEWPLLGGQSSLARFNHGPLYIWLAAGVLELFDFNPEVMGYVSSLVGLVSVGGLYLICRKYFSVKVAQVASLVLAASPLAVLHSRMALHINPIPLMSLVYFLTLVEFYYGRIKIFWPVLTFTLLFQFELSTVPMVLLLIVVMWLRKKKLVRGDYGWAGTGLVIGLLPQIVYDLGHKFEQLVLFGAWIGYRVVSFFGYDVEHVVSLAKWRHFLITALESVQKFFSWGLSWPTVIMVVGLGLWLAKVKGEKRKFEEKLLVYWLGLVLISFFVLGAFYDIHFGILFVPLTILLGLMAEKLRSSIGNVVVIFLIVISVFNSVYLLKQNFMIKTPYGEQLKIIRTIMEKTEGAIELKTDDGTNSSPSAMDNYVYLLKYLGNREVSDGGTKVWIMQNSTDFVRPMGTYSYEFESVIVSILK